MRVLILTIAAGVTLGATSGCSRPVPVLVGTWRAEIPVQIDGKPTRAIQVVWRLNADGTADYGGAADNRGTWAVLRREGDRLTVQAEVGGTVTEQVLVLEGQDQFKLVSEVDQQGRPRMKAEELPGGGLTFRRANE